jgi:hypothetical protein
VTPETLPQKNAKRAKGKTVWVKLVESVSIRVHPWLKIFLPELPQSELEWSFSLFAKRLFL